MVCASVKEVVTNDHACAAFFFSFTGMFHRIAEKPEVFDREPTAVRPSVRPVRHSAKSDMHLHSSGRPFVPTSVSALFLEACMTLDARAITV